MPTSFGFRTGSVGLAEFDLGMAVTLGAELDNHKNQWALPLNIYTVDTFERWTPVEKALVGWKKSEPTHFDFELPEIIFVRDNVVPAANRLQSPTVAYRLPAPGAQQVVAGTELGYTQYETKDKEEPYDIFYTIECWSRYRTVAQILLQMIMKKFPMRGNMKVVDSLGVDRTYAVYQLGTADLTQVSSMVDRVAGFSLSLRVEGELTLDREPFIVTAFTGDTSDTLPPGYTLIPGNGEDGPTIIGPDGQEVPYPGPNGLYGSARPVIRLNLGEDT